jgi:peptide chain release factor 1
LVTNACEEKDMREMAAEELLEAVEEEKRLQHELFRSLLPKDEADERDCILEVRAGKPELALYIHELIPFFQFYSVIGSLMMISFGRNWRRRGIFVCNGYIQNVG